GCGNGCLGDEQIEQAVAVEGEQRDGAAAERGGAGAVAFRHVGKLAAAVVAEQRTAGQGVALLVAEFAVLGGRHAADVQVEVAVVVEVGEDDAGGAGGGGRGFPGGGV